MASNARMDTPASDIDQLPDIDQLLQAVNILRACIAANNDPSSEDGIDLSYPMWAAVSLLEDVTHDDGKIIRASTIVKAVAVTLTTTDQDIGTGGFEPSWCLDVAIDLIDEVIHEGKGKKRSRSKKAMRQISTVDPDCAREFHRLLVTAARLPLSELKRIARYAEIELAEARANVAAVPKAPAPSEPPEARP